MKVFRILLTTIMMIVFSTAVSAQEANAQQTSKKQRMSREQMAAMQAKHIARQLALDDATSQKFIETYSAYQKEVWALRPKGHGQKKNRAEMTDAEAEKAIKDQFEHSGPANQRGKWNGDRPNASRPNGPGKGPHNGQHPHQPKPQKQNK